MFGESIFGISPIAEATALAQIISVNSSISYESISSVAVAQGFVLNVDSSTQNESILGNILIVYTPPPGISAQDKIDIISGVWQYIDRQLTAPSGLTTAQEAKIDAIPSNVWNDSVATQLKADISFIKDTEGGKWEIINNQMIFYQSDNATEVARFNLFDKLGNPSSDTVYKRERV